MAPGVTRLVPISAFPHIGGLKAQLVTLTGVAIGIVLNLLLRVEAGAAVSIALSSVIAAWVLGDGAPVACLAWQARKSRCEPLPVFWRRIFVKFIGLCALTGTIILACSTFPFLEQSAAIEWLIGAGTIEFGLVAVAVGTAIAYLAATDRLSETPDDYLYQVGRAVLLLGFREADVLFAIRVVIIKCFFLVLMFSAGMTAFADLANDPAWNHSVFSAHWFDGVVRLIYLVDVILAAGGYIATFKLFGWHIRATETTPLGWIACLLCYDPFYPLISRSFLPYGDGPGWAALLQEGSPVFYAWSVATLVLHLIYVWATVCFGPRFSNLTDRGIVTGGPYRLTKHPAYIAKNMAWWLLLLPGFIASGPIEGLKRAGMLAIVSFVYFQRARAEERMLSANPDYQAYCAKISEWGLLASLRRLSRRYIALCFRSRLP
ncbi:methyltransferase family protein [Rhizobium lusitanum]|uniref:Protein-S-isoprenylcysteine O-methyltransferase Ste14 n=1 Tax=Rhizobium lusitanum TaxID=293958 RepID=A0A7X0ITU0_9HYPH|nr:DUF1295 domain-containing protein [Rhizobium lusitanum]MBB6487065.1 protein-S-isoprenylcysteine O-methyltransferase Ste14 [Rhizobium lusitanum]